MEKEFDRMARYILGQIDNGKLDDGDVYEFVGQGSKILEQGSEVIWKDAVADLWASLQGDRNLLENNERGNRNSFLIGRVYSVMELIKLMQQHQVSERVLQEDAKYYATNERKAKVFNSLKDGRSMTHGELAEKCGFSDPELSQFMRSIKDKNYILSRKTGRTKYYRLSNMGNKLLNYMPVSKTPEITISFLKPQQAKGGFLKNNYIELNYKPVKTHNDTHIPFMIPYKSEKGYLSVILDDNNSREIENEEVLQG